MTGLGRLYIKELREHRILLGGTVGAIACLYAYVLVGVEGEASRFLLASFPISITTAALTFGLISSFWSEWKSDSHYLLLTLPVSRVAIPLSKYLAVMTAGLAVYVMAVASILLGDFEMGTSSQILTQFDLEPQTLMVFFCTQAFAWLILLLGIVVFCVALRYALHRGRVAAIAAFLMLMFFGYWTFVGRFAELMGPEVGFFRSQILYTSLLGLLATAGGMILFDRKAEV